MCRQTALLHLEKTRFKSQTNYTDDEDFIVDEASLVTDQRDWEGEAGIFDSETRSSNFLPEQDLMGVRLKSSTNTRTDLDISTGTPIFIFLNQRSRVEVFKDNRLIDAKFYDAGNRQLDSSRFPDGAYQISVRIREENGAERREEYFFVRNALLPPINEPLYFVEAGEISEVNQDSVLPDGTGNHLIHAGGSIRLKENLALEAEVANTSNESMAQVGLVHIAAGLQSQFNIMATTESDWGVTLRENWAAEKFTFNLDLRYIHEGDEINNTNDFDFVSSSSLQASGSLSHKLFGGRVFWRYRHIDRDFIPKSETFSVRYKRSLYRKNGFHVDLDIDGSKDSDDYLIGTRLNFNFQQKNNSILSSIGHQSRKIDNDKDDDVTGNASWQHTVRRPSIGQLQSRLFHVRESEFSTTGVNLISESRYGYNQVEFDHTRQSDRSILGYSVRSQFNLASDFKHLSVGGSQFNPSAIIVDLVGNPKGAKFEVFVDRQSAGYAEVGAKTVIPLPAYKTYDVRLESRTDSFVTFDESAHQVTLYPGNVNTLQLNVDRVIVHIGQALHPDGSSVANARIENVASFAGTDERGWFQVETGKLDSIIFKQPNGKKCEVILDTYDTEQDVIVFNQLTCQPIQEEKFAPTLERTSAQLN